MTSKACWIFPSLVLSSVLASAQANNVLSVAPLDRVTAKPGATLEARAIMQLRAGYHTNSNAPTDEFAIPFKVTWTPAPLESPEIVYPKPKMEKYRYTEAPIPVFTGEFTVLTHFKVPASAKPGPLKIAGKVRYQACSDQSGICLPPVTLDVSLPVDVVK
jgi:DsbC/DsbD-like thiol-disulfide interchange protein